MNVILSLLAKKWWHTVNIKNGDLQVGRSSNPAVISKGGTVNLDVDGITGNFTGA